MPATSKNEHECESGNKVPVQADSVLATRAAAAASITPDGFRQTLKITKQTQIEFYVKT